MCASIGLGVSRKESNLLDRGKLGSGVNPLNRRIKSFFFALFTYLPARPLGFPAILASAMAFFLGMRLFYSNFKNSVKPRGLLLKKLIPEYFAAF